MEVESECPEATLPSEFTPSNLRQKELFIKGTEPTNISTRFSKLSDINNLKATTDDNIVTLTWDSITIPEINTESYLKKYFSSVFVNQGYLNSYVSSRLQYNKSNIGDIGYNVYIQDSSGNLKLLDFVSTNKYKTTLDQSGEYTFVVKTSYSIFKNNMSDGKSVKIKVTTSSPIIPEPNETEKEETDADVSTDTDESLNTEENIQ